MNVRKQNVTVYTGKHRLYLVGSGFALSFGSVFGTPSFEITDGEILIEGNETTAHLLGPFEFDTGETELVEQDVTVTLYVEDGDVKYVKGSYGSLPGYSPYYGVTDDNENLYKINALFVAPENPHFEGDELLNIPDRDELCNKVRNVESGLTAPVNHDLLQSQFNDGNLHAAIPVQTSRN